jgi:ABC-type uncharacterized transport system involved in gliding motility auxiliary subunit
MKTNQRLQFQLLIQNGIFAVLLVAVACLAVYVLKDNKLQADITLNQRNTLSQATRDVLKKMDGPISITAYATAKDPAQGDVRRFISEYLAPYQQVKRDLTLKFVDPREQPKLAEAAKIRTNGELVIEYGKRTEHLTSLTEQNMANLLMRLLRSTERLVMHLDGHGEPSLDGSRNFDLGDFGAQLRLKGFRLQGLSLAVAQEVPDNCSVLVIAQPRASVLKGEVDKIKRFLDKGGSLLWLIDEGPLHGLEPLAEYLQLRLPPGVVVDPAGQELAGNASVAVGIPNTLHPAGATTSLITVFPLARPIVTQPGGKTWRVTPVIEAAQRGWVETGDLSKKDLKFDPGRDTKGPVVVVAALERDVGGKPQRIVAAGSSSFLSNAFVGNAGNLDLGVNLMNWLSADENLITVQPRNRIDSELKLTRTSLTLIAVGFQLLLPAAFLFAGGMIWWRRRQAR